MEEEKDLVSTLDEINKFLKQHLWCDFEVISYDGYKLEIGEKTGFYNYDIKIVFEDVYFLSCLAEWRTDTSVDQIFSLTTADEAYKYNRGYGIIQGYNLFKILAEDIDLPLFISAKAISYEVYI